MQFVDQIAVTNKRVFLRADLNVPITDKKILFSEEHNHRLNAILPTINYIIEHEGKIVLATHIGRPPANSQKNFFDETLSTKFLMDWFKQKGFYIEYEIDLLKAAEKNFKQILLLENLRFFNGEKEVNNEFAQLLAQCADVYVNDAFGLLHRSDTSVTLLPQQFEPDKRAFGFLVQKEINELTKLKQHPQKPFVIVLGGNKIETKLAMLDGLLEQPTKNRLNTILIGGAIANTFLKAQGFEVGQSKIEEYAIPLAHNFLEKAKKYNVTLIIPTDVMATAKTLAHPPKVYTSNKIPPTNTIVDIGPQTIELFKKEISTAKTIFANGTMGIYEKPAYQNGSKNILQTIAQSPAYSAIGGGDTVSAVYQFNFAQKINFLSTGGGATLAFFASKNPSKDLPAIKAMEE